MSPAVHLVPLAAAAGAWYLLYRLNRIGRWFRMGELIFWDAIVLILVFLIWVRWF